MGAAPPSVRLDSTSGSPLPVFRWKVASTDQTSPPTTGRHGNRPVGSNRRGTRSTSGTNRRRPWTERPVWVVTASGSASSGHGSCRHPNRVDRSALDHYAGIVAACVERGLEPLVTLHHFTHPAWLGEDFWIRPDAAERFRSWAELVVEALAPSVHLWVTINEINVLFAESWVLGSFPPGRRLAHTDAAIAASNLLAAHVAGYEVIHQWRGDASVTTNNGCSSLYELDRMLSDILLAKRMDIDSEDIFEWLGERRHHHDGRFGRQSAPESGCSEGMRPNRCFTPDGWRPASRADVQSPSSAGLSMPYTRVLTTVPSTSSASTTTTRWPRGTQLPGRRTAGGRERAPRPSAVGRHTDPGGLRRRLRRSSSRWPRACPSGWSRTGCATASGAVARSPVSTAGTAEVPPRKPGRRGGRCRRRRTGRGLLALVIVDNYEWGSYKDPRLACMASTAPRGTRWLDTDAMGDDAAAAYRSIIAGLRAGDRTVLDSP